MPEVGSRPIFEVQLTKNAGAVADYYRSAFQKKFNTEPSLTLDDTDALRHLVAHFKNDVDRCRECIDTFLTLQDKELVENGYAPTWMKRKMNRVLIAYGQRSASVGSSRTMMIQTWVYCANVKCGSFEIVCKATEVGDAHYCRKCAEERGLPSKEVRPPV